MLIEYLIIMMKRTYVKPLLDGILNKAFLHTKSFK